MRNTQASCYGTVGNQSHHAVLPTLLNATEPTAFSSTKDGTETNDSRSQRLFGREGVLVRFCGGPCVKLDVIEMAFGDGALAL
jgi:hypothetical protein